MRDLRHLAKLCAIAYEPNAVRQYLAMGYSPTEIEPEVFVLAKDGINTIVIAGTNDWKDWVVNCLAVPLGRSFEVHPGYAAAAVDLYDRVLPYATPGLMIVGHSKGGAIAALLGNTMPNATIVTFGSPRIGSAEFAERFNNDRYYRVVNPLDLVCRLPAHAFGYRHCGKAVVLYGDQFLPDEPTWQRLKQQLPLWKIALMGVHILQQHFIYWK
jgi:hypothetical protein